MNVNIVGGKKVIVVDDAFDDNVLRKWVDYYPHKPFYNNGVVDSNFEDGLQSVNFNSNFHIRIIQSFIYHNNTKSTKQNKLFFR